METVISKQYTAVRNQIQSSSPQQWNDVLPDRSSTVIDDGGSEQQVPGSSGVHSKPGDIDVVKKRFKVYN
eukprot:ANDGO_04664.mRNA.1 hypothetical protein